MAIIEVRNVVKEFRLGHVESLKTAVLNGFRRLARRPVEGRPLFKALDDVSFTVEEGEVLGIVGHNGAGKSTLLKILSRITVPTRGAVSVRGRIAPLIEVGAGFVSDLSGRENVFLNGAILGMSRRDIAKKFDSIVEFAELEDFIDTPIKRYSSGMQVRLGFALATSVDADVLIVDEVLAVGDIAFQRKSIGRMEELIKQRGNTVILVGHNIRQLERVCTRMIHLKRGRIEVDGTPSLVMQSFLASSTKPSEHKAYQADSFRPSINSGDVTVRAVELASEEADGMTVRLFSDVTLRIVIEVHRRVGGAEINLGIHNAELVFVSKSSSLMAEDRLDLEEGIHEILITIPRLNLCPGPYGVGLGIYDWARRPLWAGTNLLSIHMTADADLMGRLPVGTQTYSSCSWEISRRPHPLLASAN